MEGEERREIRARQGGQRTNTWRMSKLAWRFLFQKNSALAQGYRTRTGGPGDGATIFRHACWMDVEGIVPKRIGSR